MSLSRSESARLNGAKSRGPVTAEGKAKSSRNSFKHGLCSSQVVLEHENKAEFEELRDAYMQDFQPTTKSQADLVETMANARWRLNRLMVVETQLFDKELGLRAPDLKATYPKITDDQMLAMVFEDLANHGAALAMLSRYEGQYNRTYDRAFRQLQALQKVGRGPSPAPDPLVRPIVLQNEPKPAHNRPLTTGHRPLAQPPEPPSSPLLPQEPAEPTPPPIG